jgi:hypothetical protein
MAPFIDLAVAVVGTAAVIGAVRFVTWQVRTFNRPATPARVRPPRVEPCDFSEALKPPYRASRNER